MAAISTAEILPVWVLAFADWCYKKFTHRAPEGDALHIPKGWEQLRSFLRVVKQAAITVRVRELPDELFESAEGADSMLEIRSSQAKTQWTPPLVVRVGATYYRLEYAGEGQRPRPFVYRLRRLAAGVPGRNVIFYNSPVDL